MRWVKEPRRPEKKISQKKVQYLYLQKGCHWWDDIKLVTFVCDNCTRVCCLFRHGKKTGPIHPPRELQQGRLKLGLKAFALKHEWVV